jgi:hypothetical protein
VTRAVRISTLGKSKRSGAESERFRWCCGEILSLRLSALRRFELVGLPETARGHSPLGVAAAIEPPFLLLELRLLPLTQMPGRGMGLGSEPVPLQRGHTANRPPVSSRSSFPLPPQAEQRGRGGTRPIQCGSAWLVTKSRSQAGCFVARLRALPLSAAMPSHPEGASAENRPGGNSGVFVRHDQSNASQGTQDRESGLSQVESVRHWAGGYPCRATPSEVIA